VSRQSAPLAGEEAWVPPPVEGDLLWPRRTIFGGDAKWTPYRGKTHQACTTCVEVLIDHGKQPYPREPGHPAPATKRRKGPNGDTWHCARHGAELERKDAEIAARLAAMRAHEAHMAHGRRR
jgi:hypothetical protein